MATRWCIHPRFTPTRVGKSGLIFGRWWCISVHPHTCGEIRVNGQVVGVDEGSPPHVWGNLPYQFAPSAKKRFTPTRVGKSAFGLGFCVLSAVHPHTCGEICDSFAISSLLNGSPPHVWGNLPSSAWARATKRFTPTRVGKSLRVMGWGWCIAVHPHTCGEILLFLAE